MTVDEANRRLAGQLPGLLGIEFVEVEPSRTVCRLELRPTLLAANGRVHGGTIAALADTGCGIGAYATLPEGATGIATIELKCNFTGTVRAGDLLCTSTMVHGGRTTQVWDARVEIAATAQPIAHFRCTQLVLYSDL